MDSSLLAEVSQDETNKREERDLCRLPTSSLMQPPTKLLVETYRFQNRFRLMCNARALLDCTLTIIELTVDYGFHEICEFRDFSVIKSSVSTLGDKRIKKLRLYKEKSCLVSLNNAIRLRVSRRATASLSFLPRRERPLSAGKPLHSSLARRHSTNRFLLKEKSPESQ